MTAPVLFVELDGALLKVNPRGAFEVLAQVLHDCPEVQLVGLCGASIEQEVGLEGVRNHLPLGLGQHLIHLAPVYGDEKHEAVDAYCEQHAVSCHVIVDHDPWAYRLGSPNLVLVNPALGLSHPASSAQLRQAVQTLQEHFAQEQSLRLSASGSASVPLRIPHSAPVVQLHSRSRLRLSA